MTKFRKALRSQIKATKHAFKNIGFHRRDKSLSDFAELMIDKATKIGAQTCRISGGWGTQRGRM